MIVQKFNSFVLQKVKKSNLVCLFSLILISSVISGKIEANVGVFRPFVEVEETVNRYEPANNGAWPLWCWGSTCIVRTGQKVFASGIETVSEFKPLNNCRWMLFQRDASGWEQVYVDPTGRTREPCPLAAFPEGQLFMSVNPTLLKDPNASSGPARPEILEFAAADPKAGFNVIQPKWKGVPEFTEYSYRSFAADGPGRELILFQNVGYTHAEWTVRDSKGQWVNKGELKWPWGAEYDEPQPIRVCYPNVAIKNRAVHFCGVSDILEPYGKWRKFKRELTGNEWDYDFRRLFYTWSRDITNGKFEDWIEIASRDKTCGGILPGDLWIGPDGTVHIVWTERAIDERLRDKFFPGAVQSHAINYATVRDGKIMTRRSLVLAEEGKSREIPKCPRFHVTPENRLFVLYYVDGTDSGGKLISENRVLELYPDGSNGQPVLVPLKHPMNSFFTATVRAGVMPSNTIDLFGISDDKLNLRYARILIKID